MPSARKKSSKKTVSVMESSITPTDPCPLCGRCGPIEQAAEPAAEPVSLTTTPSDETSVPLELQIEQAFDDLPVQLPPSVRKKLSARLLKRNLHPSSEEGVEIVKTTCAQYLTKKERAKAASAARRAAARSASAGDDPLEQADDTP